MYVWCLLEAWAFIRRYLVNQLGLRVTVVPWDYDFTHEHFDGLFLSNFG